MASECKKTHITQEQAYDTYEIPGSYKEALKSPDSQHLRKFIMLELLALELKRTWKLTDTSAEKTF